MPNHIRRALIGSALVVALSLSFCLVMPPPLFLGWVAYLGTTPVPLMLVAGFVWRNDPPAWLAGLTQPKRGLVLSGITLLSAVPAALLLYWVPGHGEGATPTLVKASITCVVAAFWLIVAWRGWPISLFLKDPTRLGLALWVGSFALGTATFYPAALVFLVTTSAVIAAWAKCFSIRHHPLLVSLTVLGISALWMRAFGMEEIDFMVQGPVALIFGLFLTLNMTRYRLFAELNQPVRGACQLGASLAVGILMETLYSLPAPGSGHPRDIWVATALLSVTFPLIIVVANYFELWPLNKE